MKPAAIPITQDEALAMIAVVFNEPAENVHADTSREALQGWDSMGVLLLTAELDERFGVELVSSESARMKSVGDVLQFLREKGALLE